jgi:CSLREA domain-containing protein
MPIQTSKGESFMKAIQVFLTALLLAALLLPAAPAHAIIAITVETDADNVTPDGLCTLREAITNANNNAATYADCSAGSSSDGILFAGDYTITLGSALPEIMGSLTISGNGAANTIIQASTCNPVTLPGDCTPASYSVLRLSSGANLTLDNLTLRHGNGADYGGGISPPNPGSATLTITNSVISGNSAVYMGGGTTAFGGSITVTDSTFSGNFAGSDGGAIFAMGSGTQVNITRSTLSGNHANQAGGAVRIYNNVTSLIKDSTFSGNSAGSGPAGNGGAIASQGAMTIANSTISGNSAVSSGGGVYASTTSITILNSTITGNSAFIGGGVFIDTTGTLIYKNTIIANSPGNNNCDNRGNPITSVNTLDETGWCSPTLTGDPMLGPLADNGGPTQTHDLLPGSPAAGAGDATACANAPVSGFDQRGVSRPQGSGCDMGAVEHVTCYNLTLSHSGSGADPVASPANTLGCTAGKYAGGQAISLAASPAANWTPGSWSGTDNNTSTSLTNSLVMPAADHSASVAYQPLLTLKLRSQGSYDGWILESAEGSNQGGTLNATATTFRLGDDATDRQYRAILSFDTSTIPANAVITVAKLKIKKQGLTGSDPFVTHTRLKIDMKKPFFGAVRGLGLDDFNALAGKSAIAAFNGTPTNEWYSAKLSAAAYAYINRSGTTQFRLRFILDDDDDLSADFVSFLSGEAGTTARPVLVIKYYLP